MNRPAVHKQSAVESSVLNAVTLSESRYRVGDAIVCDESIGARVSGLLVSRCPSAVIGLVVAVSVDTVEGVFLRRTRAHVCEKRGIRRSPVIAHRNSPAAPVRVGCGSVTTTTIHALPCRVGEITFSRSAMCLHCLPRAFVAQASAGIGVPRPEISSLNYTLCSTVASTQPAVPMVMQVDQRKNDEAPEAPSYHVLWLAHVASLAQMPPNFYTP